MPAGVTAVAPWGQQCHLPANFNCNFTLSPNFRWQDGHCWNSSSGFTIFFFGGSFETGTGSKPFNRIVRMGDFWCNVYKIQQIFTCKYCKCYTGYLTSFWMLFHQMIWDLFLLFNKVICWVVLIWKCVISKIKDRILSIIRRSDFYF